MEFDEVVRRRRMVRSYDPNKPISLELVNELLSLAIKAPSAGHTQGWRFLVLHDIISRTSFWTATTGTSATDTVADGWLARLSTAPVLIVCFSDKEAYLSRYAEADKGWTDRDESRWPVPYWDVDTGMAAMITLLAAVDHGLGACFFGVPTERWDDLAETFAVPAGLRPVGVISLGYPAPDRRSPSLRRGRRPLQEVVRYGSF